MSYCAPDPETECKLCGGSVGGPDGSSFTMAFQPIYDITTGETFAHEALVRPSEGGNAQDVLNHVVHEDRYRFDRECRIKAIVLAARLGIRVKLSLNCLPNAILDPQTCLRTTLLAAKAHGVAPSNLIFEFTEDEAIAYPQRIRRLVAGFKHLGILTAIDDFGAGHAGLGLMSDLETDIVKLDMRLVRNIHRDPRRSIIVQRLLRMCADLGTLVVVEGVECREELDRLKELGATHVQGYLLGTPLLDGLRPGPAIPLPLAA